MVSQASLIYRPDSITDRLPLDRFFPAKQPLEIELGSGDGSFLAQYAARHPEYNFIGVERLLGRLRKLDRKGLRAGLKNLRLIRIEASYFLEFLLPSKCVRALHVYFPDPWPKRKHRKHRLVNDRFTEVVRNILEPAGVVYLRTDDTDYFAQMTAVFGGNAHFRLVPTPDDLSNIVTDFERDFNQEGIATLRTTYQLQ